MDIKFLSRATFRTRQGSDVRPLAICMAFQSKMTLLASHSSPASKCFLFRLLMMDREREKQKVKGIEEQGSNGRHFKSQKWACLTLLKIKPAEGFPVEDRVSVVSYVNVQLHMCKHTRSWSLLSLVEHIVPPGQFSLNWHYCHAVCGHAVCSVKQASTDMQGSYVHRGTVVTNACKGRVYTCTCDMSVHANRYMPDDIHARWLHECFCTRMCKQWLCITWAGQGSFLSVSLFFTEWEKAVSNFLLSTAGRCFSAVSCNLFQLCVLIIACSW